MKDRVLLFMLCLVLSTCTLLVEREQTKRLDVCKEYLLKCGELGYTCSCP